MNSWKNKVADKLARLLADSPSSPTSPASPRRDSPFARPHPQAFPPEELNISRRASFSSHVLPLLNSTNIKIDAEEPNSPTELHNSGISAINIDHLDKRDKSGSVAPEEASTSSVLVDFSSYFKEKSMFMNGNLFELLNPSLPNIVKGCQWVLLYSTWKNGISLRTLVRQSQNVDTPGPCLLIAGDTYGTVFGGLVDSPLNPTAKKKYQGTNQTFVFTTVSGDPMLYRATGGNRYYYMCMNDVLVFGGGGSFALTLDEDLLYGSSGPCETFGNPCLAHSEEFELKNVELWGFTHSSHHLAH